MREYPKVITLRLTEAQAKDLRGLATKEEVSVTDIVRDMIAERIAASQ